VVGEPVDGTAHALVDCIEFDLQQDVPGAQPTRPLIDALPKRAWKPTSSKAKASMYTLVTARTGSSLPGCDGHVRTYGMTLPAIVVHRGDCRALEPPLTRARTRSLHFTQG